MRVRTDDDVYRVDAVWLGPPKATFPFRARYVAWGVGILVFLVVLGIERRMDIGFGFFSTAWAVVITIAVTRIVCSRISHERPLGAVMALWLRELTAPRERTASRGGAASAARVRVQDSRPRPQPKSEPGESVRERKSTRKRGSARRGDRTGDGSRVKSGGGQQSGGGPRRPSKPAPRRQGRGRARSKEVRGVRSSARS